MVESDFEPASRSRRLLFRMLVLIGASYAIDTALLTLFAWAGVLASWVPAAYGLTGLAWCGTFLALAASRVGERFADSNLTLAKLLSASIVQLIFAMVAPAAALYFISLLFVVFAFASLRLRPRDAFLTLAGVVVALSLVIASLPSGLTVPQATAAQKLLVGIAVALTLVRCTLLGLYSSWLRDRAVRRQLQIRMSLEATEQRGVAVAEALHEGLGQELAGVALLLSASATRLQRAGAPGANEVLDAVEHLRTAIDRTRHLADTVRPEDGGRRAGSAPP